MIKIDMWDGHNEKEIAAASVSFYPNAGIYRGNVYDKNGDFIGDFSSLDSVEIENRFPGIFGE